MIAVYVFSALVIVVAVMYTGIILLFTSGWYLNQNKTENDSNRNLSVTVIVAVRNEKANILQILGCLTRQSYPAENFRIIISDDNSDDGTVELAERYIREKNPDNVCLLKAAKGDSPSKKKALQRAIDVAETEWIMTTDADCIMGEKWLTSMIAAIAGTGALMLSGPVALKPGKGFWMKMQELEFMSLIASGAGAIGAGVPILCNGANLMFQKQAFIDCGGYDDNLNVASGDDVFLMFAFKRKYGAQSIRFNCNVQSVVYTLPAQTLLQFIRQRIRWASKVKVYRDFFPSFTSWLVFVFNLLLAGILILAPLSYWLILTAVFAYLVKIITDLPLMTAITRFMRRNVLLALYLPLQVIYPWYIVVTAFFAYFGKMKWK